MSFTIRNYPSQERYSIEKFLNWSLDCYDVLNSPFLTRLQKLPVKSYYSTNDGYQEIDMISQDVYGSPYFAYYIMFYNNLTSEIVEENITLRMFDLLDLDNLVYDLSKGVV